jgi:hypothetical protein
MMPELDDHLSDEKMLLFADGETRGRTDADIRKHLAACWSCRLRMRELDDAIANVTRMHQEAAQAKLPPPEGPRALLKARLRELAAASPRPGLRMNSNAVMRAAVCLVAAGVLVAVMWLGTNSSERKAIPRPDLTPGAVRAVAASDICRAELGGNANVLPAVQRQVFAEYGMTNAEPRGYEVDYLITPALGGSDDIRNLWPQPYAGSPWNAYVKDALEDYLRGMVCSGQLDLTTAQHEIAVNWIAAYKKYFHTRQPLPRHQKFGHEEKPE